MKSRDSRPPYQSKRSRLEWLLLLSGLVVLGGFIGWTLMQEYKAVERLERERLITQTRVIDEHLRQQLDAIRRILINLRSELPHWQQQPDGLTQANRRLKAYSDALPEVRTLGIFNSEGILISANREEFIGTNFAQRDYFQIARQKLAPNVLHVSQPFHAASGAWLIAIVMSVTKPDGAFNGIVGAFLDPERICNTLDSVLYTQDMWASIAHGDGTHFVMMPRRPELSGLNLAVPGSFFTRHRDSGKLENVLSGTVYSTGEERLMALRTIQPPSLHMDKPLVLAVGRDLNTLYTEWKSDALIREVLFLLIALSSIVGLYLLQRKERLAERSAVIAQAEIHNKNQQLESLNRQLRELALVDGLTGIANRRRFDEALHSEWQRARRDTTPLALLMIDVDHFKRYNDIYGHQDGDECLKSIATLLSQRLERGSDLAARYGGEEFACLLPESDMGGALTKAEALRKGVEELTITHADSEVSPNVTISIGVAALIPDEQLHPDQLISQADEALYRAKHAGRNQVCSYAPIR